MIARIHSCAWFKTSARIKLKTALTTLRRMLTESGTADVASDTVLLAARLPSDCHGAWNPAGGRGRLGA